MELALANSVQSDSLKLATSEPPTQPTTIPILRTEGVTVLPSEGTTSVVSETATTQFFNIPILQDGSVSGVDPQQSYILATSADGNTILVEASQLAVLSDQSIPLYDGSNLFQLASQTVLDQPLAFNKEAGENVVTNVDPSENNNAKEKSFTLPESDEILPPDRKGQHKCEICAVECSSSKQLFRHYWKVHADEKPNQCSECDASFNKKSNLLLHQATHCKSDPTCPECNKKFTRMASLKSHLMLHETEENLVCNECGDEFSTMFKLDKHMQEHLTEQMMDQTFVCRTCSKGFRKLSFLREHMKIHYKLKASLHRRHYKRNIDRSAFSHKCYFCGKQFQKPSQLVRHNRIHTGERPFKCDICDRAFNQKGALLIHKVKHTGERPYICEFCPAAFAQKGNLRNHIRRVHSLMTVESNEGVHKCELCNCVFRKLGSLNAHMSKTHSASSISFIQFPKGQEDLNSQEVSNVMLQLMEMSKETRPDFDKESIEKIAVDTNVSADILQQALENSGLVSSEHCNRNRPCVMAVADSATGALRRHIMRNVGGVKWYQCIYCSKEFKKPSDLVRHIRIHTHEKPYKCALCYRAFAVKSTLNAHIRTHTGVKEFSCEYCKKLFSTSGSLKVHLLLHTGAKPFACSLCNKTFRTSGHRNSHLASHQKEKGSRRTRRSSKPATITDINIANIPLQEPILITDEGYVQPVSKHSAIYNQLVQSKFPSERPHRCETCEKGFKKSSHLKQHIRSHTGEKPYKCYQCDRAFVSNGVLKAHTRTHTGMKAFNCHICNASFTTNGSLKRHMCIHSNERPYMCPYCQKTFKTSMNCKKHMNTHRYELAMGLASGVAVTVISDGVSGIPTTQAQENNGKETQAAAKDGQNHENIDPKEVVSDSTLRPVISLPDGFAVDPGTTASSSEVLVQMPQHLSQEVFNTQTGMIEQAEIIPQAPPFEQTQSTVFASSENDFTSNELTLQPDMANEVYVSTNSPVAETVTPPNVSNIFQEDVVEASKENDENVKAKESKKRQKVFKRPFKCLQCSKIFKKSAYLKQHMNSHTGEKPFRCITCGDMFSAEKTLTDHVKAKHEGGLPEFKCSVCDSTFTAKRSLERHMAVHDVSQPFHCAYCSERFSTKEPYQQHLKEYHPNNDFKEETVIEVSDRTTTIQIPEEKGDQSLTASNFAETIFLESIAEKDKDDKADYLPRHSHVCLQCSKSFKKPSDLVRHMRIHTGEKPFKCESCGKAFTVKSTLDSHLKTHTGEKNFSCHICCSLFATKGSLKVHMRLHTGARPFKCPHCELHFRTSGHRKSHMASHFKEYTSRKSKKTKTETSTFSVGKDSIQHVEVLPVVSLADEVVNVVQPPCTGIPVPNSSQASIQFQPSSLINPSIQLTTLDPSLMSKPIHIDASLLQQLQQHFNLNITINPSLPDQFNNKTLTDSNPTPQIVNVEGAAPTSSGTFTINPNMIIHQLGFTLNTQQQSDIPPSENVTLIIPENNFAKNGNTEGFQNQELFDTQVLTLDGTHQDQNVLSSSSKNAPQEIFVNVSNPTTVSAINSTVNEVSCETVYECFVCDKVFKTISQLNRHSKTHKTKPKDIYRCETCNKDFKKKSQFNKHLQSHQ